MDITRKLSDVLEIGNEKFVLKMSFNNVLKVIELLTDEEVNEMVKPYVALEILTGVNFSDLGYTPDEVVEIFIQVYQSHIQLSDDEEKEVRDVEGNVIPQHLVDKAKENDNDDAQLYSLKYDGSYIFSSFYQAYKIDLIEMQDKLHWKKFNALLNGLPSDTKLMEVIKIRSWKPQKGDSAKHKEEMKKLKELYKLPSNTEY